MQKLGFYSVIMGLVLVAGCSSDRSAIGSFMGGDQQGKMLLQVRDVKDHEVRGDLTYVYAGDGGFAQETEKQVSGTLDDGLIRLAVQGTEKPVTLEGKLSGDTLDVTLFIGGVTTKFMLDRRNPVEFAKLSDQVQRKSAELKQLSDSQALAALSLKQKVAAQGRIDDFVSDMHSRTENISGEAARVRSILEAFRDQSPTATLNDHQWVASVSTVIADLQPDHEAHAGSMYQLCKSDSSLNCASLQSTMATYEQTVVALQSAARAEASAFASLKRSAVS